MLDKVPRHITDQGNTLVNGLDQFSLGWYSGGTNVRRNEMLMQVRTLSVTGGHSRLRTMLLNYACLR